MAVLLLSTGGRLVFQSGGALQLIASSTGFAYIADGYIAKGYYQTLATPPPPAVLEGEFDLDVGEPGAARHRTAYANAQALQMAYWQPGSPYAPYDLQPIFVMKNHFGFYAFSTRGIPQVIEDTVFSFETTLVDPEPVSFTSAPLDTNIVGSVSAIQRSVGRVVIRDPGAIWAKRLSQEVLVGMPAGLFWIVKRLWATPVLTGSIGRISYSNRELTIEYGEFRRRTPQRSVRFSV
jgi:hypothetical protein